MRKTDLLRSTAGSAHKGAAVESDKGSEMGTHKHTDRGNMSGSVTQGGGQ